MAHPPKNSGSSSKQPPFVPPSVGQAPTHYRPAVHTSVRATDFGAIVDAEWTTFAQFDPKTGVRTGQLPYWFTCTCVVRNEKGNVRTVRLRDIAAQARQGILRVRISGAKNPVVRLSRKNSVRTGGKPVKPVDGFYPIAPSCDKDGMPSNNFYTLSFNGPICFLECYDTLVRPKPPCGKVEMISEGYPPPGTPPQ
jgi:hypothetical protein